MCKKIFSLLSALVLIFTLNITAFAQKEYKEIQVDVPPKIVFLGDSIATGYGLEGYENGKSNCNSYANQLSQEYKSELNGKCITQSENYAIDGQTSSELLEKLNKGVYDNSLKNCDAVVISIGGNDLLSILWGLFSKYTSVDSLEDENNFNLSEIVKTITNMSSELDNNLKAFDNNISKIASCINKKSNAVLIIQTLYNPFNQFTEITQLKDFAEQKISALNDIILTHKDDADSEYLIADVYSDFVNKGSELTRINSMDIHPNQQGHNVIAQRVDKTIRLENYSYLEEIETQSAQASPKSSDNAVILISLGIVAVLVSIAVVIVYKFKRSK
ncbi:MAG: SGNH/GDSL hydrolase family protein [Oscillospiraceae bacterium]